MMKSNIELVNKYLDYLFPNPKCELNYNCDYELLIAIMLSAQTTDKRVNMVTEVLFNKYNNLSLLKNASLVDIEIIIHPLGSFRKKAIYVKEIARILDDEYNGCVPVERNILERLPGVGRKTVNVFLSEFYNYPTIAVDTHVERVSKRLRLAYEKDSVEIIEKKLMKKFDKNLWAKRHLQLVLFGRYKCRAIRPECNGCWLCEFCKYYKKNIKD